jgi:hypothetical protein
MASVEGNMAEEKAGYPACPKFDAATKVKGAA